MSSYSQVIYLEAFCSPIKMSGHCPEREREEESGKVIEPHASKLIGQLYFLRKEN